MKKNILVVDDDAQIRDLLTEFLSEAGFSVCAVADGSSARTAYNATRVDLIVLDLLLPDINGTELAQYFRSIGSTPMIMLTVKSEEVERIIGLEIGADDYVTKPFSARELVARIRAIFRRMDASGDLEQTSYPAATRFSFGDWTLDSSTRSLLRVDGTERHLTAAEFRLLLAFVSHPRRILSREQLLDLSRDDPEAVFDRSIDYLILRLRRKLDDIPKNPRYIRTEHGVGYVFAERVNKYENAIQ